MYVAIEKHSLETGKHEYFYMCNCHCTFYITTWFNMPCANSRQDSKFKSYFRNLFANVKTASLIHAIQEFKFHTLYLRSCSLYSDFLQRHRILSNQLLIIVCLKNHVIFQIFCGRYQHLLEKYCHLRTYDKRWYW